MIPSNTNIKSVIFKTSRLGVLRTILAFFIYLILTPYILAKIGTELYGLWSINTALTTFLLISDFGFKNSLVHFTAKNISNVTYLSSLFNSIFFIFLFFAFLASILSIFFSDLIAFSIFSIPFKYKNEANYLIITSTASFSIRLLSSAYQAIVEGNQRVYITQKVFIIWLLFNGISTYLFLTIFPSIYTLCTINLLGNILIFTLFYIDIYRNHPYAYFSFKYIDFTLVKNILPYTVGIQLASIFILLREPIIKIIISRYFGLKELAAFEISFRIAIQLMSFAIIPLLTALPLSSYLFDNFLAIQKAINIYYKWLFVTLLTPLIIFLFFSEEIFSLWLGGNYVLTARIFPIIFSSFCIYYFAEPMYKTIQGLGKSIVSAIFQFLLIFILFISFITLHQTFDFLSIPYALLIAFTIYSFSIIAYFHFTLFKAAN